MTAHARLVQFASDLVRRLRSEPPPPKGLSFMVVMDIRDREHKLVGFALRCESDQQAEAIQKALYDLMRAMRPNGLDK